MGWRAERHSLPVYRSPAAEHRRQLYDGRRMSPASARIGACRSSPATPAVRAARLDSHGLSRRASLDRCRGRATRSAYRRKTSPPRSGCSGHESPGRPLPTSTPPSNRARSCGRGRSAAPCTCCPRRCSGPSSRSPVPASCSGPPRAMPGSSSTPRSTARRARSPSASSPAAPAHAPNSRRPGRRPASPPAASAAIT